MPDHRMGSEHMTPFYEPGVAGIRRCLVPPGRLRQSITRRMSRISRHRARLARLRIGSNEPAARCGRSPGPTPTANVIIRSKNRSPYAAPFSAHTRHAVNAARRRSTLTDTGELSGCRTQHGRSTHDNDKRGQELPTGASHVSRRGRRARRLRPNVLRPARLSMAHFPRGLAAPPALVGRDLAPAATVWAYGVAIVRASFNQFESRRCTRPWRGGDQTIVETRIDVRKLLSQCDFTAR